MNHIRPKPITCPACGQSAYFIGWKGPAALHRCPACSIEIGNNRPPTDRGSVYRKPGWKRGSGYLAMR